MHCCLVCGAALTNEVVFSQMYANEACVEAHACAHTQANTHTHAHARTNTQLIIFESLCFELKAAMWEGGREGGRERGRER